MKPIYSDEQLRAAINLSKIVGIGETARRMNMSYTVLQYHCKNPIRSRGEQIHIWATKEEKLLTRKVKANLRLTTREIFLKGLESICNSNNISLE